MNCPRLSRTITSVVISSTPVRITCSGAVGAGACGFGGGGFWARTAAPVASATASAQGHSSRGRVFTCMLRLYRELASGLARRPNRRRRRRLGSSGLLASGPSRVAASADGSRIRRLRPARWPASPRRRRRRFWPTTSRSDANTDSYCSSPWTTSSSVTQASGLRRSACSFSSSRRDGSAVRSEIRARISAYRARSRCTPSAPSFACAGVGPRRSTDPAQQTPRRNRQLGGSAARSGSAGSADRRWRLRRRLGLSRRQLTGG